MKPEAGDLFSCEPRSYLGFFYNTEGSNYSSSLVRIGRSDDIQQNAKLEGRDVTIPIAK
jgi:hypothetical protein